MVMSLPGDPRAYKVSARGSPSWREGFGGGRNAMEELEGRQALVTTGVIKDWGLRHKTQHEVGVGKVGGEKDD